MNSIHCILIFCILCWETILCPSLSTQIDLPTSSQNEHFTSTINEHSTSTVNDHVASTFNEHSTFVQNEHFTSKQDEFTTTQQKHSTSTYITQEESSTSIHRDPIPTVEKDSFSRETIPPPEEFTTSTEFPQDRCEEALPGCRCFDYAVVKGIYCPDMPAFDAHRLAEVFETNTTFEVTLVGGGVLRRGTLDGLIVFRLFLDGVGEVEEGAFDGVIRLRRFHVQLSTLKTIPDFRPIRDSLRNVHMDNSQLTSVEGLGLTDLPLLDTLSMVNNSIRWIHPNAFHGSVNIAIFDMSRNLLSSLPPDLFSPWKNLMKVVLSRNRLLHVDRLFQIARPRFIYLDSNQLTDLDSVLYPNMRTVETIQLSNNPLGSSISNVSFNGRVNSMRFLYLDHCGIRHFDVRHYAELANLSTLDLSHNIIEEIEHQTVGFGYNLELDLTANKITEFNAELPYNVRRLFLTGNLLSSVGRTLQFSQMTEVTLADNRISRVLERDFVGVHGVRALALQGNRIEGVESAAFSPIRRDLVHLDLSRNRLRGLGGCVKFLSALTSLNLTDNMIERFDEGEFTGLNELTDLYLGGNQIVLLSAQLQFLPQLQYLVVSYNRIRTMHTDQIPSTLKYLYLQGNPFQCDCELLPFLVLLNSTSSPGTDVPICLPPVLPERTNCPSDCSCACSESTLIDHYIEVDCSKRNLSEVPILFPDAATEVKDSHLLSVSYSRGSLEFGPFWIEDGVGEVDLSHNSLSVVDRAQLPDGLRVLRLDSNFLTSPFLPSSMPLLKSIALGNNPWTCDCDSLPFKKWIVSKSDIVEDFNFTKCGPGKLQDEIIWTLLDFALCPTDVGFYVSLSFAVLSVCLLLASVKIAWTRWSVQVRVWLYSKGVTWAKERDVDLEKRFDAFLSFSHKDSNFVIEQIVNVIEKRAPNVRLCLHYKHFIPGEFIHDNILNAVNNSKRTVLILSRNFLESEWCLLEFRAAHLQALRDRVHRVVVIKVGELPDELMDSTLRLYLDSTTYLTWGEGNFWDNLLYVLPTTMTKAPMALDILDSFKK